MSPSARKRAYQISVRIPTTSPTHHPARPSSILALARSLACSLLLSLGLSIPASAAVLISGVQLTVAQDDTVTITNQGVRQFFGDVGVAGNFALVNGWGIASGQVTWTDTNANTAATLNATGVHVPVSHRVANQNGAITGSVVLTGSTVLGGLLRSAFVGGTASFTLTIAQGSIVYSVSGIATIVKDDATLINGMQVDVDKFAGTVTVTDGGSPLAFGEAGDAGTFSLENGWKVLSGDLTWRNTLAQNVATLYAPGLNVVAAGRSANSSSTIGSVQLGGTSTLATLLKNQYGDGASAFKTLVATSPTTDFYFEGIVTVPEPGVGMMGLCALAVMGVLRRARAS